MNSVGFDTLRAAHALQEAGIERGHAEAIAHVVSLRGEDYATKADIAALEARLETKFEGLETKFEGLETKFEGLETKVVTLFEARIEQAKNVILRSILTASVAIIVTLLGGIFAVISAG